MRRGAPNGGIKLQSLLNSLSTLTNLNPYCCTKPMLQLTSNSDLTRPPQGSPLVGTGRGAVRELVGSQFLDVVSQPGVDVLVQWWVCMWSHT